MPTPSVLAIVPARGGSKGVPGKNSRLLHHKPLIGYAIETSLASKKITCTVVNTDSEAIAAIAQPYAVHVQMRESALATDEAPILPVIQSTVAYAETRTGISFDIILLLQPTAPFRTGADADAVIQLLIDHPEKDGVISVVPVGDNHPSRMYWLNEQHDMQHFLAQNETGNRQQLAPLYIRNGCFYAIRKAALFAEKTVMPAKKIAYIMPSDWHVNIDEEKDFLLAEVLAPRWIGLHQL